MNPEPTNNLSMQNRASKRSGVREQRMARPLPRWACVTMAWNSGWAADAALHLARDGGPWWLPAIVAVCSAASAVLGSVKWPSESSSPTP